MLIVFDPQISQHLSIACATILFYEYFLTFFDEVRLDRIAPVDGSSLTPGSQVQYAWRGKKTNWGAFYTTALPRDHP